MHNVTATSDRFINSVRAGPRGGAPVILLHALSLDLFTGTLSLRDYPKRTTSWPLTGQVMEDLADSLAGLALMTCPKWWLPS
jgi:hypothetical protein